ncbi:MAG: radical SAM protein, partial [Elusimicrobiota bacterium]
MELFNLTYKKNIPLMCVFELTGRCNLRCLHCYIPEYNVPELTTDEVFSTLRQMYEAGCMYVVFTGGEPFIRADIFEILGFAKSLHFDVRVFSNATLIDGTRAKKISQTGISSVEVSLYGRQAIHDRITGVSGSFKKTVQGLMSMKQRGIKLTIKCPVMKLNFSEYPWLINFARENNFNYRFDASISPKTDGNCGPLKYRINKSGLKKLFSDKTLVTKTEVGKRKERIVAIEQSDFSCSAGKNFISITCCGDVFPCLQMPIKVGNVREMKFRDIMNSAKTAFIRNIGAQNIKRC